MIRCRGQSYEKGAAPATKNERGDYLSLGESDLDCLSMQRSDTFNFRTNNMQYTQPYHSISRYY